MTLKSVIFTRRQAEESESDSEESDTIVYDYLRPAAAALGEFAPRNEFYAGGRRVVIRRIDTRVSPIEKWRLCPSCRLLREHRSRRPPWRVSTLWRSPVGRRRTEPGHAAPCAWSTRPRRTAADRRLHGWLRVPPGEDRRGLGQAVGARASGIPGVVADMARSRGSARHRAATRSMYSAMTMAAWRNCSERWTPVGRLARSAIDCRILPLSCLFDTCRSLVRGPGSAPCSRASSDSSSPPT